MTTYHLPFEERFIQCVRMNQALMEAGLTIVIDRKRRPIYDHLSKFFQIDYTLQRKGSIPANVEYLHKEPFVRVGLIKVPLLYSPAVIARCLSLWQSSRAIDYFFMGKISAHRSSTLRDWQSTHPRAGKVLIENSLNGRTPTGGAWDQRYYTLLGKSKFVLCPNGSFVWTYRFFEAILCGAIPVVYEEADSYAGFHYHLMSQSDLVYDPAMANQNFQLALKRLTIPQDVILTQIDTYP